MSLLGNYSVWCLTLLEDTKVKVRARLRLRHVVVMIRLTVRRKEINLKQHYVKLAFCAIWCQPQFLSATTLLRSVTICQIMTMWVLTMNNTHYTITICGLKTCILSGWDRHISPYYKMLYNQNDIEAVIWR